MKNEKRLWASLLALIPALLIASSCQANQLPMIGMNAALPAVAHDFEQAKAEDYTIEVSSSEIITLIESRASFLVYIGNDYCTSCAAFQPAFFEYIFETGMLVYHYDNVANGSDYDLLTSAYPDYFIDNPATPSLLFFKEGEMRTRQNGTTRMFDINTLRPIMESYAQVIDLPVIHDSAAFANEMADGVYFVYDRQKAAIVDFYIDHLLGLIVDDDYRLRQLEVSLDAELATAVVAWLGDEDGNATFYRQVNEEITASISLQDDGVEATLAWLSDNIQ